MKLTDYLESKSFFSYIKESDGVETKASEELVVKIIKTDVSKIKNSTHKKIKTMISPVLGTIPDAIKYSQKKDPLSKKWSDWTGKEQDEPKTDIKAGDFKISLKNGTGQLMSAKAYGDKNETIATINASLDITGKKLKLAKEIVAAIKENGDQLRVKGGAKDALSAKNKKVLKIGKFHKEITGKMRAFFDSNTDIFDAFVYEAMTGAVKFGGNDGTANTLVVIGKNNIENTKAHKIKSHKDPLISKIRQKANVSFTFKSGGSLPTGERDIYSALRVVTAENILTKSDEKFLIAEGIMDTISSLSDFLKKVFVEIFKAIKKGFKYLLDFLDIGVEAKFNNSIDFENI